MNPARRSLVVAVALLSLVACGKSEPPPPPPKVEAPRPAAPTVDADVKRLAAEVHVYAFPMVLMDVTRAVDTAKGTDGFTHPRSSADATTPGRYPNPDFVYSDAWVDLSKEPVLLSVPDTKGRYYLIAMLDAWTNVAGSIGKRTTGTEKGDFALVGPKWKGTLPGGVSEVRSPTEIVWLLARTRTAGKADDAAAIRVAEQFRLAPLSQRGGKRGAKAGAPPDARSAVDTKTEPRDQVTAMDASTFYTRFASLLPANPPTKDDAAMIDKIRKLGIVPGQPFDVGKLEPLVATSASEGAKSARDAIVTAGKGPGSADVRNGWTVDRDLGRWGVDYGRRAVSAWRSLASNAPEDAIFMTAHFDGGGRKLDGTNRYVLRFDKGGAPPADGFWSVAVYDDKQRLVANRLNRFSVQSDDAKANGEGSIDLYVQNADPGRDKEANWLPAPKGAFSVMLRVYWPRQEVLDGRWTPPGIRRAS